MTDRFVVRVVVLGLLALGVCALGGIVACALTGHNVPDVLQNIAVGALTALGAVLAKTNTEAQPVVVQNEPVETVDVPAGRRKRGDAGLTALGAVVVAAIVVLVVLAVFGAFGR